MEKNPLEVLHDQANNRFIVISESHTAVLEYRLHANTILFTHTGVPPELEGRGIGRMLVKTGLEYARNNKLKVETLCWFVSKYIQRHPESVD